MQSVSRTNNEETLDVVSVDREVVKRNLWLMMMMMMFVFSHRATADRLEERNRKMLLFQTRINAITTPFGYRITTINAQRKISRPSFRQPSLDHLGYGSLPVNVSPRWSVYQLIWSMQIEWGKMSHSDCVFVRTLSVYPLTFKVVERKQD